MKLLTAAFVGGLLLISTHANAQVTPGAHQVGINIGFANPLNNTNVGGDSAEFGRVGPAFGVNYFYQLQRYLSLGGDFNYKNFGSQYYGHIEVEPSAWTLLAIGRLDLLPDNNIRPYGLLGLGVGGARRELDYPTHETSGSSVGLAFALGAGVDYDINASWLVGAELRYSIIGTNNNDTGADSVSSFDVLFKGGYKF